MKAGIHPNYKKVNVTCACGSKFEVESTNDIVVEVCDNCHPFYTGKQGKSSARGNIEKFNRKYGFEKKEEN